MLQGLLKGLFFALFFDSGRICYYIIHGEWPETDTRNKKLILYNILCVIWIICILFSIIFSVENILCWFVVIAFPIYVFWERKKNIGPKDTSKPISENTEKELKLISENTEAELKPIPEKTEKELKPIPTKAKKDFNFNPNKYFALFTLLIVVIAISFVAVKVGLWRDLKYKYALHTYEQKNYSSSIESFKKLGSYKESKFYYYDSIYNYAKSLINNSDYRQASAQLNLLKKLKHSYDYNDFNSLMNQCSYYLDNAEEKFNAGDYKSVISMLEYNDYSKAITLYNKAIDEQYKLDEQYVVSLYKEKDYSGAFCAWYDLHHEISDKYQTKIINSICKELIQIYKDDSIDFYGHSAENDLLGLGHEYWTPTYKKWMKAYDYYYDEVYDY